jgi:hypothetical protein
MIKETNSYLFATRVEKMKTSISWKHHLLGKGTEASPRKLNAKQD